MKANIYFLGIPGFVVLMVSTLSLHAQRQPVIDSLHHELSISYADTHRVKILNEMGGYLLMSGDYHDALPYLNAAKDLAEKLGYMDGLATCLNRMAIMYMDESEYEEALKNYREALEIRKQQGDLHGIADIVSNIGIVYSAQGEYPQALNCYLISLKIREGIHDPFGIGTSLNLIANLYFLQKRYSKALEYYFDALHIKEIRKDPYFTAVMLSNIGITYVQLNNYTEARKYFNQALQIDERIGDKEGVANSYNNIGEVLVLNGKVTDAIEFYQRGLDIFIEIGHKMGIAESYASLGRVNDTLGHNEQALAYFKESLRVSEEIKSKVNMSQAYLAISNLYKKMHQYEFAYESFALYKQMEDEIHNESAQETMNEMEVKYKTQKKETEIEILKTEKYQEELVYHQQRQLAYGIILLLIIASLVLFLIFNRIRIRKKQALERKNFEIQLKALSEQMNPHFIFNALNSVMEFIRTSEKEAALKYLTKFARLIRLVLESSGKKSVLLTKEIELLKLYMELENLRFGGLFTYEIKIDEKLDIHEMEIPPLIIQPFIENAILHGIQNKQKTMPANASQGHIQLDLVYQQEFLECTITDNGIGRKKAMEIKNEKMFQHQSLGMRITGDRLSMLSQNQCTVEFTDLVDKNDDSIGTRAKIFIPLVDPFQ